MSQAPGWYSDPFARDQERYWDGRIWTQGTRPEGSAEGTAAECDLAVPASESSAALSAYAPIGAPTQLAVTQPSGRHTSGVSRIAGPAHAAGHGRQRSRTRLGIGAAALLLVAGGVSSVFVLGGSSVASAQEAVANAATQTMNAQTADVSISMDISTQGVNEAIKGNGGFDFAHKSGSLSLTIPLDGPQVTLHEILDGSTVYVNVGDLGTGLPDGKTWISEDMSQLESLSGGFGTLDPASMLQRLASLGGTVTSLGSTTYEGAAVTEYSATLPASALEGELGKLPSLPQSISGVSLPNMKWDIYVTDDNLLKALTVPSFSMHAGGQSVSMDMTVDFSNYGATVNATPPPADQVEPLADLGAGGFGNSGSTGNTGNTGSLPSSGSALSAWTLAKKIGFQRSDFPAGTVALSYNPAHPDHTSPVPASTPCSPLHSQPFVADYDSQAYDPSGIGHDDIWSEVLIMPPANAQAALRAIAAPGYDTTCFQPGFDENSQTMTPDSSCGSFRFLGSSISELPSPGYLPGSVMYRYQVNMSCTGDGVTGTWYTDLIDAQEGSTYISGTFNSFRTPISAQIEQGTMTAMAARAQTMQSGSA